MLFRTLSARSLFIIRMRLWPLMFRVWRVELKTWWSGPLSLSPLEMKMLLRQVLTLDLVIWWSRIPRKLPAMTVSAVILESLLRMLGIPGSTRLGREERRLRQ